MPLERIRRNWRPLIDIARPDLAHLYSQAASHTRTDARRPNWPRRAPKVERADEFRAERGTNPGTRHGARVRRARGRAVHPGVGCQRRVPPRSARQNGRTRNPGPADPGAIRWTGTRLREPGARL